MLDGPVGLPLDLYKTSDAAQVDRLVRQLFGEIVRDSGVYLRRPRNPRGLQAAIQILCLNLLVARIAHPNAYVFYSRSRNDYSHKRVSFDLIDKAVGGLENLDYVDHAVGEWHGPAGDNRRSRIRARKTLQELIARYGVQLHMVKSHRSFEVIRLRDENKKDIPLPTSDRKQRLVTSMTRKLKTINALLAKTFIGLHISDMELHNLNERLSNDDDYQAIDFTNRRLYRVFNDGSLKRGGRFYGGWWQQIPREFRKHIYLGHRFGGQCVYSREVDYSSMQPALAYAKKGLELKGDAYTLDGLAESDDIRQIVKKALLVMLNTKSRRRAILAIHKSIRDQYSEDSNQEEIRPTSELLPGNCPPVNEIVNALESKHRLIFDLFYKQLGLGLMYLESNIAEGIMLRMAEDNIAALPVHDSFLVRRSFGHVGDWIHDVMMRVFYEQTGVHCEVKFARAEHETDAYMKRHQLTAEVEEQWREAEEQRSEKLLREADSPWSDEIWTADDPWSDDQWSEDDPWSDEQWSEADEQWRDKAREQSEFNKSDEKRAAYSVFHTLEREWYAAQTDPRGN